MGKLYIPIHGAQSPEILRGHKARQSDTEVAFIISLQGDLMQGNASEEEAQSRV